MNLKQALQIIDSGQVFSLRVVSFDKARKKGGKIRFYSELKTTHPKEGTIKTPFSNLNSKAKNHFDNSTRTCFQCISNVETSSIVTIHIFLILQINSERVML